MERRPITVGEQIISRIDRRGECWWWTGNYTVGNYPVMETNSGILPIIPLLWRHQNEPVGPGLALRCIHPSAGLEVCVNPAHYQPGPSGQNRVSRENYI